MIKYIGSKRLLVDRIVRIVDALTGVRTVGDFFSGTSRVGHALKRRGYRVIANDHNAYAHVLATCYVQADAEGMSSAAAELLDHLARVRPRSGPFTEAYCVRSRYFRPENGMRIEAIRDEIERLELAPELRAIALTSLLEAADRVDSTTGVQMAYLKRWAPRAHKPLELRRPELLPRSPHGPGLALRDEAIATARAHEADVVYLDPPYNQHSYLGNYHVWESLVRWDHQPTYGVACKRIDCKTRKSPYNSKRAILPALTELVRTCRARTIVVSFNDEGYVTRQDLEAVLGELWNSTGELHTIACDYRRYVGARIGIHDRRGVKVGQVGRLRNVEYLYVASREPIADRLRRALVADDSSPTGRVRAKRPATPPSAV